MKKQHLVITAGPTYEPIDPVRGITNLSTGVMGYELAGQAVKKGYKVTLISGPVAILPPKGVKVIHVLTALEMQKAVYSVISPDVCLIMAAAVSDFRVKKAVKTKKKKGSGLVLRLVENPDIIGSLKTVKLRAKIGFALESKDLERYAAKKLNQKGLDMVIGNVINSKNRPFGKGKKDFIFLIKGQKPIYYKNKDKRYISAALLDTLKKIVL